MSGELWYRINIDSIKILSKHKAVTGIFLCQIIYTLLKERKKEQAEHKILFASEWKPHEGLENLVVTTNTGRPLGKAYLNNAIDTIARKIQKTNPQFKEFSIHSMRHTFATRCIENGMEPQVLKAILGHSKLSMTMDLYAHVLPDTKSMEIQKIAGLFQNQRVS